MNIKFQRAVDRYAGVPICAMFSLVNRIVSNEPDGTPPKNIMVILLSEMGSLVLAHPMFMRLKQLYPEAKTARCSTCSMWFRAGTCSRWTMVR
jgi:hypothetical protein